MTEYYSRAAKATTLAALVLSLSGCSLSCSDRYIPTYPEPVPTLVATPSGSANPGDYQTACDFLTGTSADTPATPPPITSIAAVLVNRAWMDRNGASLVQRMQTGNEAQYAGQVTQLEAMPSSNDEQFAADARTLTKAAQEAILSNLASSYLNDDPQARNEANGALAALYGGYTSEVSKALASADHAQGNDDALRDITTQQNLASVANRTALMHTADGIQAQVCGAA